MTENLLETNALTVIIAILGLLMFFYTGYKIYTAVAHSQEQKNAQSIINILDAKIKALEVGKSADATIQGFPNADSWYLAGWNTNNPNRPDKCSFNNCICICKPAEIPYTTLPSDACKENGFCREVKETVDISSTIDVTEVFFGETSKKISTPKFIQIEKNGFETINLAKENGKIKISRHFKQILGN